MIIYYEGDKMMPDYANEKKKTVMEVLTDLGFNPNEPHSPGVGNLERFIREVDLSSKSQLYKDVLGEKLRALWEWHRDDYHFGNLLGEMLQSYQKVGNFTHTRVYREHLSDMRRCENIPSQFGYDPNKVWHAREDAIKAILARSMDEQTTKFLGTVLTYENCCFVREVVEKALKRRANRKDFINVLMRY